MRARARHPEQEEARVISRPREAMAATTTTTTAAARAEAAASWHRRRRRQRRRYGARAAFLLAPYLVLASALFVAARTGGVEAAAAPWGGSEVVAAVAAEAAAAAAGTVRAAATAASSPPSPPTRSLLQQQAAIPATTQAEEDALAAAVAAAAAAIDPPTPEPAGANTANAFSVEGAAAAAATAAAADGGQQQQEATEQAVVQAFTNNLAAAGQDAQPSWDQQGLDGAADFPPAAAEDNDDAPPPDPSAPPLRPVPGAAAACSPQVGNGGASLVSAAPPASSEQQQQAQPIRCRLFEKTCLDHDSLVLYAPRHNPRHPSFRSAAPALELPGVRADYHSCDGAWGTAFDYPPPLVRPATPGEESDALSSPAFSRCTVPVLLFPSSLYELGDFFRNTVATVRGLQIAGLLDRRMTLAVAALGMRLEPWHAFLLRPFSAWAPTTLSHLSSRLPVDQPEPYSPDGTHVRCFSQLLACPTPRFWAPAAVAVAEGAAAAGRGLLATAGRKPAAGGAKPTPTPTPSSQQHPPLWATGQDVLEHYRRELPPDGGIPIPGPGAPPEDPLYPHALRDPSKLRVLVAARRSRAARARLLNQEQVWSWCTKFAPPPGVGRAWNGTACALHEFGRDLPRDLALASRADVLIAMHGPDLYLGALAMPRRSSVIEIRPYGFNSTSDPRADAYFRAPLRAENDALFWWGVDVEDPGASKPGQRELEGRGDPAAWPRDRHVTMRLVPLQYLMERIALSRRDVEKYRGFRARRQAHVSDGAPPRNLGLDE